MPQPTRISRYEIKSPIGGGGMGTLYLARDTNPTTDRLVALKLLKAMLDSGDLRARFAREAQSLARLNHPNIVNIYDSGEFRGAPFIVMEYVRGETLAEKIKRRAPMSLGQKLKLLIELCSGLAHAHDTGIIHRDIKPANLMVDQQGHLKIVDFGIARVADSLTQVAVHVTQLNMQIGTPGYMSPEQIEGNEVDHRSDLFAVGAVAYELLSAQEAFSGGTTKQVERKVLQAQPAPLLSLVPDLDPAIADIVATALEKDPNRRYQDAVSVEEALHEQLRRLGRTDTPVPPRATPQPGLARGRVSRADAAYRQAVSMANEGAPDAARRHLLEALAEEPGHPAASTLLSQLEGKAPRLESTLLAGNLLTSTVVARPTAGSGPRGLLPTPDTASDTEHLRPFERTAFGATRGDLGDRVAAHQEPTVVIRPKTKRLPPGHPPSAPRAQWSRGAAPWDPRAWSRLTLVLAVALPVILAVVAGGLWLWPPWAAGQRLTVARPEGGTITTTGITCGAEGSTCSASFSQDEMLEFEAHAATGFMFTGFTGDCAPSGRTMMNAPRECGATFERADVPAAAGGDVLLTIAAPIGGTIVGQGVLCGSQGKECSGKFSPGFVVELQGHADDGYTFQGFSGDCGPDGKTIMAGPRTCGATFVGGRPGPLGSGTALATPSTGSGGPGGNRSTGGRPAGTGGGGLGTGGGLGSAPVGVTGSSAVAGPSGGGPTSGATSPPLVAASAEDPDKPVRAVITREAASRALIAETLEKYLAAYGKLDYQELQSVFPTAPRNIRVQLDQYRSLEYSFGGPPRFLKFDPDAGSALIELDFKQVFKPKVGGEQPPNEGRVTFQLHRLHNDDWVIDSALFKGKK